MKSRAEGVLDVPGTEASFSVHLTANAFTGAGTRANIARSNPYKNSTIEKYKFTWFAYFGYFI